MTVSPATITLPPDGGMSIAEAAQATGVSRCVKGVFCGEGAELHRPESVEAGVCCCCRAGTRHHD